MKISKDSPIIKHNVKKSDWKLAQENARKVAICVRCEIASDHAMYCGIIAELEYEEYLEIKHQLKDIFGPNKYWTIGGLELGFLYPLKAYSEKRELSESSSLFRYSPPKSIP